MDTLSGLHNSRVLNDSFVRKRIKKNGTLFIVLEKSYVGRCCHNKMLLLSGKRLVRESVILEGKALL